MGTRMFTAGRRLQGMQERYEAELQAALPSSEHKAHECSPERCWQCMGEWHTHLAWGAMRRLPAALRSGEHEADMGA